MALQHVVEVAAAHPIAHNSTESETSEPQLLVVFGESGARLERFTPA